MLNVYITFYNVWHLFEAIKKMIFLLFTCIFPVCLYVVLSSCSPLVIYLPLGSLVCCVFFCFVTFPYGVLGQMLYLIVSIADLCLPLR